MFFQKEYIREDVTMTVGSTYRLDLPEHGLLSSLFIKVITTNVGAFGQGEADWRPIDELSKFEVILDGATICKSLTGYQVSALSFFDQGVMPPSTWRNYATNTQVEYLLINFGRYLHDLEYGLDLAKYNNVELRITNTADATDFSAMTVAVLATYLREAPAGQFKGHMRSEEWRQWTGVQDATEYLTIPTEHIIRRIILQGIPAVNTDFVSDTGMHSAMDDIAFSMDTGAVRIYKGGIDALVRDNFWDQGKELIVGGQAYQLADDGVDIGLGYTQKVAIAPGSKDGAVAGTIPTLEAGTTIGVLKAETYEGDSPWLFMAGGLAPFYCAQLRFDHDPNPLTWLDPSNRASVLLDIHTRNSAASDNGYNAVILDRLVR
jgi:hypothetical protein